MDSPVEARMAGGFKRGRWGWKTKALLPSTPLVWGLFFVKVEVKKECCSLHGRKEEKWGKGDGKRQTTKHAKGRVRRGSRLDGIACFLAFTAGYVMRTFDKTTPIFKVPPKNNKPFQETPVRRGHSPFRAFGAFSVLPPSLPPPSI